MPTIRAFVTTCPEAADFAPTLVTPTTDGVKGILTPPALDTPRGEP
jgi:hypothetical protein